MKFMIHQESSVKESKKRPPCDDAVWYNGKWVIKLHSAEDFEKLVDELETPIILWPKKKADVLRYPEWMSKDMASQLNTQKEPSPLPLITIYDDYVG